ncbi:AIM24 family protein [Methylorubrum populi]|uniref:AIM24 family protein n=1 Tax=Methylorubrum populi TaxID=223967 RepID=UPI000DB0AB9A|nr:AIM24 family protein [Methylorubrum populi]PZP69464.1 MAG: hypothetical protein DI590_14355 [Methylorubrum populi]
MPLLHVPSSNRRGLISHWKSFSENSFWFLVLVSWLPIVANLQDMLVKYRAGANPDTFSVQPNVVHFLLIAVFIITFGLARYRYLAAVNVLPALLGVLLGAGPSSLANFANLSTWLLPLGLGFVALSASSLVIYGRLRSPAVAIFLLLAAIEAFSGIFPLAPFEGAPAGPAASGPIGPETSGVVLTFGRLFQTYSISLLDLIFTAFIVLFGRFIVMVWEHNRQGLKSLNEGTRIFPAIAKTVWLSLPFFLIVGALSYAWSGIAKQAEIQAIQALKTTGAPDPKTLEEALQQAAARENAKLSQGTSAALADARNKAQQGTTQLVDTALPGVRSSFPSSLMSLKSCRWYDVLCHVMNGVKSVVNSIYRKARDAALNTLESELRKADAYSKDQLSQKQKIASDAVNNFSVQTSRWSQLSISKAFETAKWIGVVFSIYGFMVCVKVVMVILSRILYRDDRNNQNFSCLGSNLSSSITNPPFVAGNEIDIRPGGPDTYIALKFEIRNAVANISIPQPTKGVFGRLLSGRYVLGRLRDNSLPENGASIVVKSPSQLVSWQLEEGEQIIIRFRDLVAFSNSVTLTTEVNFSLQATLFGRCMFHKIVGPGIVVMQTDGEAVAGRQPDASESRRVSSLKAWDLQAGFQIQSNLNWIGVYFGDYNVRKHKDSMLIYDFGPKNSNWPALGLLKSARAFLLPF